MRGENHFKVRISDFNEFSSFYRGSEVPSPPHGLLTMDFTKQCRNFCIVTNIRVQCGSHANRGLAPLVGF